MILIYSLNPSARLIFITQFLFESILGVEYKHINNLLEVKEGEDILINYSGERSQLKELFLLPNGLLEQHGVHKLNFPVFHDRSIPYFFKLEFCDWHFDVFAASFYLISRYEEYLDPTRDIHGRFEADQCLALKENFLHMPIVDIWAYEFKAHLKSLNSAILFKERKFNVQCTIDIDQAFSLKGKSLPRKAKSLLTSLWKGDLTEFKFKLLILSGIEKDPFDQFERLEEIHKNAKLRAIYFILFSAHFNRMDININTKQKDFLKRIKKLGETADIGIHPSYYSKSKTSIIETEKYFLSNAISKSVVASRQHYLRMRIPNTYKSLISTGIQHDYTMGYASRNGFRAGTCTPFPFYELNHDHVGFLTIHPFCLMDATFKTYLKVNPEQAFLEIEQLVNEVKKVDGTFSPLWHNESMSGYGVWKGWENVYERMIHLVSN